MHRLIPISAFALLVPVVSVAAPQPLNNCQTLSQPGSYEVNRNLNANGDCLVIAADFVTVDLNGFVLSGNGTGAGIAVPFGAVRRGLSVRNGAVTGFANGIDAGNSAGASIERVNASANTLHGIVGGDRAVVTRSLALNNGGDGIRAGRGATISGSVAGDNQNGISVIEGSSVLHSVSRNNRAHGVVMACPGLFLGNVSTNSGTMVPGSENFHETGGCENVHNAAGPQIPGD